jgi:phosphoserine phosphatase RsbU/P
VVEVVHHEGDGVLASAGHPAAVHLSAAGARFVRAETGPPLGAFPASYTDVQFTLAEQETLVLYTDGVTEARQDREQFGEARLLDVLAGAPDTAPGAVVEHLRNALSSWCVQMKDDIQVLALRHESET